MFIFSFKTSKKQILSLIVAVCVLIVIIIAFAMWPADAETMGKASNIGSNDSERIAFLTALGYQVDSTKSESKEVLIPTEFDDVFKNYDALQKNANMTFEPYQGKRVACWTYKVVNIPDKGEVYAHLYVYKDKIVGGDISSTAVDGFMFGLISHKSVSEALKLPAGSSNVTDVETLGEVEHNLPMIGEDGVGD